MSISDRARAGRPDHCQSCGVDLAGPKRGKPRSVPQHRRYFAMIRAAHAHWPEAHRFKPMTDERLRKWLQAKAGYAVVKTVYSSNMTTGDAMVAIAAELMTADPIHFTSATVDAFYIIESKSIDFDTLPHLSACALFDAVADVITAETGLKVDDIMPPIRERKPAKAETFAQVPL
ncbi:hypothetical protein UFOVP1157_40 [uncultured Caudovirales phage]|uniref:Uncharacterized protein n=1 Tax=uncultured Caudovirales phage TaxID=2100421 RepID=A0A6J7XEA6_9CAUD|nr:hypothetical protein UFOVP497_55 [uncultured Caudovirales phage]CAB4164446.1 hypothetical protein UFOVP834_31 [uncultured Caudovirales phage]CAB4172383.1 hypothetical protein UFOVP922_40 [uncultured Caudovirales phage]CAB4177685.1 hypothetical protein UFOVP1006_33 [uncultured Caudovirales phage]CAB4184175.1 hypothetical protein UFOVP1096_47 [uncultured Caudovirales phage]